MDTETVEIELTDKELATIKALARKKHMSLNRYVNAFLRKALKDGTAERIIKEYQYGNN